MSAIDPQTFSQLRETTGADFVAELVATFLDDAPGLIAALRASAAARDAAAFRRAAHTLKSNGNTFGATALAAMARELENRGPDAAGDIDALEQAYAVAAAELKGLANG
jgi:HPt (histidine-containing phosphotransfer) domain-containing protein